MALNLEDRVRETTTSSNVADIALAGPVTGFQSFAIIGNGNTTYYCIAGQGTNEWEVGVGTYVSSTNTLERTTVLANSAGTEPAKLEPRTYSLPTRLRSLSIWTVVATSARSVRWVLVLGKAQLLRLLTAARGLRLLQATLRAQVQFL